MKNKFFLILFKFHRLASKTTSLFQRTKLLNTKFCFFFKAEKRQSTLTDYAIHQHGAYNSLHKTKPKRQQNFPQKVTKKIKARIFIEIKALAFYQFSKYPPLSTCYSGKRQNLKNLETSLSQHKFNPIR